MHTDDCSHFILHDWPDADCKRILDNLKPAMKKGYSKLLLHEIVLESQSLSDMRTTSDITMMGLISGRESK